MKIWFSRLCLCLMVVGCAVMVSGCATKTPEGKPLPVLTFDNVAPLPVKVAEVNIQNKFDPSADPRDVSSSFPSAPDVALRQFAEKRIQPAGSKGTLEFVIEDAHIHHSLVQPAGKFTGWLGLNRKDLYEVSLRIRMYVQQADGAEGEHSILNLQRSIAIPQRYSVAQKDQEKFNFLEMLMDDVDKALTETLKEKMKIAGMDKDVPSVALLASPEIRGQQYQNGKNL